MPKKKACLYVIFPGLLFLLVLLLSQTSHPTQVASASLDKGSQNELFSSYIPNLAPASFDWGSTNQILDDDNSTPLISTDVVQLVWAGPDGQENPPTCDGQPGGDDQLLDAATVAALNPLSTYKYDDSDPQEGGTIYIRAWNDSNVANATHYGNSTTTILSASGSFDPPDWNTNDPWTPIACPEVQLSYLPNDYGFQADEVLIGETFQFTVTFDNVDDIVGYGPFIQLMLPASGIDGSTSGDPCDGIEFISAELFEQGAPISTEPSLPPAPTCGTGGNTIQIPNPNPLDTKFPYVEAVEGNQIMTLMLPFGSFVADQPPIDIIVTAKVHEYADVNQPLTIRARGGFLYGYDPVGDPPVLNDIQTNSQDWDENLDFTPVVLRLTKQYLGPEQETTTGPNFVRQYRLNVDIANGQSIDNLILTDDLPNNVTYLNVVSTFPSGAITPPSPNPGGDVVIDFSSLSITGNSGSSDVTALIEFYVPEEDANNNLILDPATCNVATSLNNATSEASWTATDPRDGQNPFTSTASHTLADKCIAIQKSVSLFNDLNASGLTPGDTLKYRLDFQVSDFFTLGNIVIEDLLKDGQSFVANSATLEVSDQHGTVTSQLFPSSHLTIGSVCSGSGNSTPITFDVSTAMSTLGHPNNYLTGGHATTATSTTAATGRITFKATINDQFSCSVSGNSNIDEHDRFTNQGYITSEVLDNNNQNGTGVVATDSSHTTRMDIASGTFQKEIVAVNGNTTLSTPVRLAPSDEVTFRLTYQLPSGDAENFFIEDFLPLPLLDVDDVGTWIFDSSPSTSPPPVGTIRPHTNDTITTSSTPTHCVSKGYSSYAKGANSNSLCFDYGNLTNSSNSPEVIDLLFTIKVNTKPYEDQLQMANDGLQCEDNSAGQRFCQRRIAQFLASEPMLKIHKGVVATSNPENEFDPPLTGQVPFTAPGSACPRFTAPVISADLNPPLDSNLSHVDANDEVTFVIVVENTGTGPDGAFNIQIKDLLPNGFSLVGSPCVTNGAGTSLPLTGNLFTNALELTNPLPPGKDSSGNPVTTGQNMAIITFDATLDSNIKAACYENEAHILQYAGSNGGPNYVGTSYGGPYEDVAEVCTKPKEAHKSIVATSEAHTANNLLAIGEIARYRLVIEVPEGFSPNYNMIDPLPSGFSFLSDNTAKVEFISNGALSSSSISGIPNNSTLSTCVVSNLSSLTPSFTFPASNISGAPSTPTFEFGDLTNNDNDNDCEFIVIEFNALVGNTSTNNAGNTKSNLFKVEVDGKTVAESNSISSTVAEPKINLEKTITTPVTTIGDTAVYQITFTNNGSSAAFELELNDSLPSGLSNLNVLNATLNGSPLLNYTATSTTLQATINQFNVGDSVTIEYEAQYQTIVTCADVTNIVKLTYTSLPASGTVSNPTGSSIPGNSGDIDGERDGSQNGANDYYKESEANLCPDMTITKQHIGDFIAGQTALYALTVTNIGNGPTTGNITVEDTLPTGLTFNSASGAGWGASGWNNCTTVGQLVTCEHSGPIPPNTTTTINITVDVDSSIPSNITNCASVSTQNESNPNNNSSCDSTNICSSGTSGTLSITPVSSSLLVSDTMTVDVVVNNVLDLQTIDLDLTFDPTIVEVTGITAGNCPTPDLLPPTIAFNNLTGEISYLASQIFSPFCSNGTVFSITFHGLNSGASPIDFSHWDLVSSNSSSIPVSCTQDGLIDVLPTETVEGCVEFFGRPSQSSNSPLPSASLPQHEGAVVTAWVGTSEIISTTTASDGCYNFKLPAGTYNITVEADLYLDGEKMVTIPSGTLPTVTLLGGDVFDYSSSPSSSPLLNDDDEVIVNEYLYVNNLVSSNNPLLVCGDAGYISNTRADINADCVIDSFDVQIIAHTFSVYQSLTPPIFPASPVPWP